MILNNKKFAIHIIFDHDATKPRQLTIVKQVLSKSLGMATQPPGTDGRLLKSIVSTNAAVAVVHKSLPGGAALSITNIVNIKSRTFPSCYYYDKVYLLVGLKMLWSKIHFQ